MVPPATPPVITLLTDFGLDDEYVGVLKGVILAEAPHAKIVDLSHAVEPQDIRHGALLLARSYRYFPAGTVHLVIVDPGVGSDRAILAGQTGSHLFVGPDNGVLTPLLQSTAEIQIHRVTNTTLQLATTGSTFHGRDIMAPVAGRLAAGMALDRVGPATTRNQCITLTLPAVSKSRGRLTGEVIHIDRFGNLCTNISRRDIQTAFPDLAVDIHIGSIVINGLSSCYSEQSPLTPLALFDSHDQLELAVCGGSAYEVLGANRGARVVVCRPA